MEPDRSSACSPAPLCRASTATDRIRPSSPRCVCPSDARQCHPARCLDCLFRCAPVKSCRSPQRCACKTTPCCSTPRFRQRRRLPCEGILADWSCCFRCPWSLLNASIVIEFCESVDRQNLFRRADPLSASAYVPAHRRRRTALDIDRSRGRFHPDRCPTQRPA